MKLLRWIIEYAEDNWLARFLVVLLALPVLGVVLLLVILQFVVTRKERNKVPPPAK